MRKLNAAGTAEKRPLAKWMSLSGWILIGCFAGVLCGVFFGDYCEPLSLIGDIFVGILRMTVLPFIIVSLVANLGRLSLHQSRRLALTGGVVLLLLWAISLLSVFALASTFPAWKGGSFFSTALTEEPREFDFVAVFIPSNIFQSLSENQIPAVVLLCVCSGLVLSGIKNRQVLITQFDLVSKILLRIAQGVTRLTPVGVFAIAASTAGTVSLAEIGRLQVYLTAYTVGALFLGLFVLPMVVKSFTPFRYREILFVTKDAMVMALATGKLIVVLPLLIEKTEQLFDKYAVRTEATNVFRVSSYFLFAMDYIDGLLPIQLIETSTLCFGKCKVLLTVVVNCSLIVEDDACCILIGHLEGNLVSRLTIEPFVQPKSVSLYDILCVLLNQTNDAGLAYNLILTCFLW
ncbi:MAG: cation:dicarboxylase symporter family transporter [Planctomycetota bacterium]